MTGVRRTQPSVSSEENAWVLLSQVIETPQRLTARAILFSTGKVASVWSKDDTITI